MNDVINLEKCYEADLSTNILALGRAVTIQDNGAEGIAIGTLQGNKILPRKKDIGDISLLPGENLVTAIQNDRSQLADMAVNVKKFGAKGDGLADDTIAIQNAFMAAYNTGKGLYFPSGKYRITSPIGINTTIENDRSMPSIIGERTMSVPSVLPSIIQDGAIILYDAVGGNALQIINNNPTSFFAGGEIRNITILNKNYDKPTDGSVGLNLKGCIEYRLYNVVCMGFDIGFKNVYGFSWDSFGLTCIRNNIGIYLGDNSNAVGIFGLEGHQNNIGIKIVSGNVINIVRATLEGQEHGIVVTSADGVDTPRVINISSVYGELNTSSLIRIGMDENRISSSDKINNVILDSIHYATGDVTPIQLDNAEHITLRNMMWSSSIDMISSTVNTGYVNVENIGNEYRSPFALNRLAVENRIGYKNPVNLVPNGFFQFPDISAFNKFGVTSLLDTTTFPGETVLKLTVPTGVATAENEIKIKIDKRMVGKRYLYGLIGQSDEGMVAKVVLYDQSSNMLPNQLVANDLPKSMGKIMYSIDIPNIDYIKFSIYVNNSSGVTKYVYLKSILFTERDPGYIEPSPIDYLSGLSGTINANSMGITVPLSGWEQSMYEVILTPYGNFTAYVTKSDNQFTITSSAEGEVAYLIIPKAGFLI